MIFGMKYLLFWVRSKVQNFLFSFSTFLKKMEKEKVNKLLDHISYEDREKLKQYGEILEEEAFVSEQRAYCQGYVDCIQLLAGLGLLKKSTDMEKIISEMKSN